MNPADAADLLAIAAAFDRRKVGRTDAIAWADALAGLDPKDCADAVRAHFRDSTDYLMPAHVRQGVKRIRAERIRAANSALLEPDDVAPEDVTGYLEAIRVRRAAIASGQTPPVADLPPADPDKVREYLEDAAKRLPVMPPAKPQVDPSARRAAAALASVVSSPVGALPERTQQ